LNLGAIVKKVKVRIAFLHFSDAHGFQAVRVRLGHDGLGAREQEEHGEKEGNDKDKDRGEREEFIHRFVFFFGFYSWVGYRGK
jgi:hypothetical protein